MEITVTLFGPFREAVGQKELVREVPEGATVEDVLEAVVDDHPELREELFADGDLRDTVNVTRNKTDIRHEEGVDTEVEDGDTLRAAPPVVGG